MKFNDMILDEITQVQGFKAKALQCLEIGKMRDPERDYKQEQSKKIRGNSRESSFPEIRRRQHIRK